MLFLKKRAAIIESITTYQDLLRESAKSLIPIRGFFELTYRCNLKCIHCYVAKNTKRELNTKEVFAILGQLKKVGCLYLTFSGGEIFTRKDFFKIAGYARKLNFATILFTNGTLINKEIADKIKDIKPLLVEISLYGFKSTYEKITQVKGSFDKTIMAVQLLKERGIKVLAKTPLMKHNVNEIWNLQRFVEHKLKIFWCGTGAGPLLFPCQDGDIRPFSCRLSDQEIKKYIKEELREFMSTGVEYKAKKIEANKKICGLGAAAYSINPYGELNPCVQVRLKKNNNLKNRSFMEIWRRNKEIKKFRNLRIKDRKNCLGCKFIFYCSYCPASAFLETGSFFGKNPEFCRYARIKKEIYENLPNHDRKK